MNKILILILSLILMTPSMVHGQKQPSEKDKSAWMKEMQDVKCEYIMNSLNLSHEQRAKFKPLYRKMEGEVKKNLDDTYKMAHQVKQKGAEATDLEYEKAAEALFESKSKEAAIEMKYYKEFKKILKPKQLFKLKKAERDFTKKLMDEHKKAKKNDRPAKHQKK